MAKNLHFRLSEIDTKGVAALEFLLVTQEVEKSGELAKFILDHSKSEDVKRYVKKKFAEFIVQKYSNILGDSEYLGSEHAKLINLYCNRAHKKLNISTDIPVFSERAARYIAEGNTLLHYDRLYTLFQSVKNALNMAGDIVELGVYRGGSLKFISEIVDVLGGEKNIVGFDTFRGHIAISAQDGHIPKENQFKTGGVEVVAAYIADPRIRLVEGDASLTFSEFARESRAISLAHFDMDLYQPTADALPLAFDLLAPGGIILLDDYGFTSCPGEKQAVDEFLQHVCATRFHLMTGQMVIVK